MTEFAILKLCSFFGIAFWFYHSFMYEYDHKELQLIYFIGIYIL